MQDDEDGLARLLESPRFELFPVEGGMHEELRHLPPAATVAITSSPKKGLGPTLDLAERAAAGGCDVVPHVVARSVRDRAHLETIVQRLDEIGVTDIFVPAGDNEEPAGPFTSSIELLTALDEMGHPFEQFGVTGYPEGHPFLDEEALWNALHTKLPLATYVVTQLCFNPNPIVAWIREARRRGIELPVYVGIPGAVQQTRLLKIAAKIGVGDSVRFLRKTTGILDFVRRLVVGAGRYTPDDLVAGLADHATDPALKIRGVHLYTFNQVESTEAWRRKLLPEEELDAAA